MKSIDVIDSLHYTSYKPSDLIHMWFDFISYLIFENEGIACILNYHLKNRGDNEYLFWDLWQLRNYVDSTRHYLDHHNITPHENEDM